MSGMFTRLVFAIIFTLCLWWMISYLNKNANQGAELDSLAKITDAVETTETTTVVMQANYQKSKEEIEEEIAEDRKAKNEAEFVEIEYVNPDTISLYEYKQIKTGMTYDEVKEIVGGGGNVMSESSVAGYSAYSVMWYGDNYNTAGGNAIIIFGNGRVESKAQSCLE